MNEICIVITSSTTNTNGELEVTLFAALDNGNGVLQRATLQAAIQVRGSSCAVSSNNYQVIEFQSAITNGDYTNAGYDEVSLKTGSGDVPAQGLGGLPSGIAIGISLFAVLAVATTAVIVIM